MKLKHLKNGLLIGFTALLLSACTTTKNTSKSDWPNDLPEKNIFVDAYKEQANNGKNNNSLASHLTWIKRFYKGSIIYPIGWNDMTEMVMDSLNSNPISEQNEAQSRLNTLGQKISIEWAQSNSVRNINSANIATWGNALRTAVKEKTIFTFLDKVEMDVDDLLARKLTMKEITRERYFPPENFDDF